MSITVKKRPYEWCWTGNPIAFELYSTEAAADPDVIVELKVFYKRVVDSEYKESPVFPYNPINGYVNADLKAFLNSVLEYELPSYNAEERKSWSVTRQSCIYYISYREITEDDPDPDWINNEVRYALKGGIDYLKWRGNNFFTGYFNLSDQKPFLTWQLRGRLASYDERMYLLWLQINDSIVSQYFNVRVTAYYADGTTVIHEYQLTENIYPAGVMYYLPAGASQWGLATANAGSPLYYWNVQIFDHTDDDHPVAVSEIFTYKLDNRNNYNRVTMHYRGSLGTLDSARVRGQIDDELNYEVSETEKIVDPEYFLGDFISPERVIASAVENKIWKGNIGFVTREEQDRMRDLHLNRNMWLWVDKKWWPMLNVTENFKQKTSEDKLFSMPLSWKAADGGTEFYTPSSVDLGDSNDDSNVCYAGVIDLEITVTIGSPTSSISVTFTVDDLQSVGVTQFQWRIPGVVNPWQTANVADLPLVVNDIPNDESFAFQVRPLCPNAIPGQTTTGGFNTVDSGGGSGDDSTINNQAILSTLYEVRVNGVIKDSGGIDPGQIKPFACADTLDATVEIYTASVNMTGCILTSNGANWLPTFVTGNNAKFEHVNIIGGMQIEFTDA
jgi:hypothetical protein